MIREICCQCQKVIRIRSDGTDTGRLVDSHGYCMPCFQVQLAQVLKLERDPETNFARPVAGVSLPIPNNQPAPACAVRSREPAGVAATSAAPANLFSQEAA